MMEPNVCSPTLAQLTRSHSPAPMPRFLADDPNPRAAAGARKSARPLEIMLRGLPTITDQRSPSVLKSEPATGQPPTSKCSPLSTALVHRGDDFAFRSRHNGTRFGSRPVKAA